MQAVYVKKSTLAVYVEIDDFPIDAVSDRNTSINDKTGGQSCFDIFIILYIHIRRDLRFIFTRCGRIHVQQN